MSGSEALYIDGRIEGKIIYAESRVTIGRNGKVDASIQAREVVMMGKVTGNIECSDRVDIRAEGSVTVIFPPCASAWKMAPHSKAESRFIAMANQTTSQAKRGANEGHSRHRRSIVNGILPECELEGTQARAPFHCLRSGA